jgi:hypothetical protein
VHLHRQEDTYFLNVPEANSIIRITERGTKAWKAIKKDMTVGEIARDLMDEFDFDSNIETGLQKYINRLLELEVLEYSSFAD